MNIIRKIAACLTAAVMAAAAISVTAGAESIEKTAKSIESGKKVSMTMKKNTDYDYKVTLSEKGTLKLNITSETEALYVKVYDKDGNSCKFSEVNETSGYYTDYSGWNGSVRLNWNQSVEKFKGTVKWKLDKGTYYVRMWVLSYGKVTGKTSVSFSYPSKAAEDSEASITAIEIKLQKGDTLQLAASVSGEGTVQWSSSAKSTAAVDKNGKVTAKAKGTAVITAKLGESKMQLKIKVV